MVDLFDAGGGAPSVAGLSLIGLTTLVSLREGRSSGFVDKAFSAGTHVSEMPDRIFVGEELAVHEVSFQIGRCKGRGPEVTASVIIMPPQHGQVSDGGTADEYAASSSAMVLGSEDGTARSLRQRAILAARWPLARNP